MMWYWGSGFTWWGWLLGLLGMVVFWGVVIAAGWYLLSGFWRRPGPRDRETFGRQEHTSTQEPRSARRILDERLAGGEIDIDEYLRLRDLIGDEHPRGPDGRTTLGSSGRR